MLPHLFSLFIVAEVVKGVEINHTLRLLRVVVDVHRERSVAMQQRRVLAYEAEERLAVHVAQIVHDTRRHADGGVGAVGRVELLLIVGGLRAWGTGQ